MKIKKKHWWTLLLVMVLVGSLLAGCGSPAEPAPAEPAEPAEPTEPAEPGEPGDQVVITVAAGAVGQELELTQKAAEMYMDQNPNVLVNVLDTPDLAQDRLGLYLQFFEAQSAEVDVYQIDVIWPGDLAEHFVDLYDFGAADVVDEHFPAIVENNTVDGRLVAIPWFTDAGLLYYRTDLLEKYNFEPPATWDELEEQASVIQEGERAEGNPDFVGFVWQGNAYEGLTCDALEWIASNDGGTIISPEGMITINNANAIEIIDQAAAWVGTISPNGVTGMGEEDSRAVWQGGNAAFMRNWPYAYSLGHADDSAIKGLFDVSPLPAGKSGEGAATLGGWQLAVSRYSNNPEIAAEVALFMAGYDAQKMRAVEGSLNPTIMSLYEDAEVLEASPFFGSLYDVFINAVARPSTATAPNYNAVSTAFFRSVHSVLTGSMDAATAFEELELDLQDITGFDIQ
ncbi:ABC transporter substrate-binding protein [Anoxynatronum sibiricum]|uniref:ABC transporter substrate-binding protein n=1 Tax=Anoxynatronum sibiricum TaxID=210623 RepID=A0ABU9VXF4_9CLOT